MTSSVPIIDADAHVIETERTWDYLEPSDRKFRPRLYSTPDDPSRQYWVIDDKIAGFRFLTLTERELHEFAERAGRNFETPQAARELDDVDLRLKHMDELGIDVQVLHNTFWIERMTTRRRCRSRPMPQLESLARRHLEEKPWPIILFLRRAGNEYRRGDCRNEVRQGQRRRRPSACGRSKATAIFPILTFIRSTKPPAISTCRLPCISPTAIRRTLIFTARRRPAALRNFACPTVTACFDVIMSELPKVFPKLRWGFIEASAQWVPWISREAAIRYRAGGRVFPTNVFEEYNIYVTCQINDDVPYIVRCAAKTAWSSAPTTAIPIRQAP